MAVTVQVILYLIDKLNVDKSLGPDGTRPRAVKELKGEIGELLAKMCEHSLQRDTMVPELGGQLCLPQNPWELPLAVKPGQLVTFRMKTSISSKTTLQTGRLLGSVGENHSCCNLLEWSVETHMAGGRVTTTGNESRPSELYAETIKKANQTQSSNISSLCRN